MHRAISDDWKHIIQVFAVEGTTSSGREMLQVKKGAFLSGTPVQPVLLEWPEWIDVLTGNLGEKRNQTRGAGWCGWTCDISFLWLLWYQLTVPWQPVHITFLPIYEPNAEERANPNLYAGNVAKVLAKAGGHTRSFCNQIDGHLVAYISSKHPELNLNDFRANCEHLEAEFGTKGVSRVIVRDLFKQFIEESNGKSTLGGKPFSEFVRSKLLEKSE